MGTPKIPSVDSDTNRFPAAVEGALATVLGSKFASQYATAGTKAATAPLVAKLKRGVQDATIVAIGDSTGNETIEHFYLELVDLASRFPAYTVQYSLWDDTAGQYASPNTIQTGTGSQTLRYFNCSVAGKAPSYVMGSRWNTAVAAITSVDLFFVSHGHNMGDPTPNPNGKSSVRWNYLQLTEELSIQHPGAGIVLMSQNPTYLTGREAWQAQKAQILHSIAAQRGYGFIDVHQAFQDTGNPQAFVKSDMIHPTTSADTGSPNGSRLWADVVGASLVYDQQAATLPRARSSLLDAAASIAPNVAFAAWTGALPDGVTATNATVAKDTTNFETGTYGLAITAGADGTSFVEIAGGTTSFDRKGQLSGRDVTVAVRMFVPSSYTGLPSVVIVDSGGSAQQARVDVPADLRDRFVWMIATKRVVAPGTALKVQIAARLSGTGAGTITIDRFSLVEGDLPRDVVTGTPGPQGAAGTASGQADHLSTMGTNPALTNFAIGSGGTMGPNAANQGIGKKIRPFRDISLSYLDWVAGASSGNYDIGIYDAATGTKLWSKGSAAWPTASASQSEALGSPIALQKDHDYWVVMSADNTAGKIRGVVGNTNALRHLDGSNDTFVANSMFPLPSTLTSTATAVAYFPIVILREA